MTYTYLNNEIQTKRALLTVRSYDLIAIDTENTGLDPYTARPLLVSISTPDENYVIDMTTQDPKKVFALLKSILEDKSIKKIGHNITYDWKIFYEMGGHIETVNMHDTMIADRLIHAVGYMIPFGLGDVTFRRLGIKRDKTIRNAFIDREEGTVFTSEELLYSAEDTSYLFPIYEQQMREIAEKELTRVYELEMAIIAPTAMMELTGVYVNKKLLQEMVKPFTDYVAAADKALQDLFISSGAADTIVFTEDGYYCLNTASNDQVKAALQKVGVDVPSLNAKDVQRWELAQRKKKGKKVDDFSYLDIVEDEEIATAIDQYPGVDNKYLRALGFLKGARILLGTFILGILERVNPVTGRVHPSFNSLGAKATGRYSSNKPNFQNLPNDKKLKLLGLGKYSIRNTIEAPKGRRLIIADYSGIELVILAVLSGDTHLMEEILRGDIHTYVTKNVLGYQDITGDNKKLEPHKLWRDAAKTLSYGIAYGTTGRNLSETLSIMLASQGYKINPQEADGLIEKWYKLFPKTAAYLNGNARNAVLYGFVTDTWGRRRNWDQNTFIDKWRKLAAEREGKNAPIQGTSATMTKRAIQLFWENADKRYARIIITVHDEIVVESSEKYLDEAIRILKWAMEEAIKETLPSVAHEVGMYESTSVAPKPSNRYDK